MRMKHVAKKAGDKIQATYQNAVDLEKTGARNNNADKQASELQKSQGEIPKELGEVVKAGAALEQMVIDKGITGPAKEKVVEGLPKAAKEFLKTKEKMDKANEVLDKASHKTDQ